MALNTSKCNHLTPLYFKGLNGYLVLLLHESSICILTQVPGTSVDDYLQ